MTEKLSDKPLGNIATKLLQEDDRVRIWELLLEPGEESDAHEHLLDYILVVLEGDRVASVPHQLSTGQSAKYYAADVNPGDWFNLKRGGIEIARNIGKKRFREIVIELKD